MRFTLSLSKSVQDNANAYFEKSKKLRKKTEGAKASVIRLQAQLAELDLRRDELLSAAAAQEAKRAVPKRVLHWYEKFRWFRSSEGLLCIGGRDASTNEIVVKKHTEPGDIVFHTEAPGSPFFVVKAGGKQIGEATKKEAAQAALSYSKAWRLGLGTAEIYYVTPDQLSKTPNTGEFLSKGAFVVRGKRTSVKARLGLAVGLTDDGLVMGGPAAAVELHCAKRAVIAQGDDKPSDAAKKIAKLLGVEIDDVLRVLPAGSIKVILNPVAGKEAQ